MYPKFPSGPVNDTSVKFSQRKPFSMDIMTKSNNVSVMTVIECQRIGDWPKSKDSGVNKVSKMINLIGGTSRAH